MEIVSRPITDGRINAKNVIAELTIGEYYNLVQDVLNNNEFQRTRVRAGKSIYSLLKRDLIAGCMIPPIVLSIQTNVASDGEITPEFIKANKDSLMILDGLQRTYTIQDIVLESRTEKGEEALHALENNKIRAEIYFGLNREGILYRMLTLNTGQTPMKLRHQVEIIYSGLLNNQHREFTLYRDSDAPPQLTVCSFKFNEAVDAFTSFLEQDYLQITRESLLENIKSFEDLIKLSNRKDIFSDLLISYTHFLRKAENAIVGKEYTAEELGFSDYPFGKNAISIFNKSQPLTGFGAAVAKHLELKTYSDICDIIEPIDAIDEADFKEAIVSLLRLLNHVRTISKKIGNSQRSIFYYFFKALLDSEKDTFKSPTKSVEKARQDFNRDL